MSASRVGHPPEIKYIDPATLRIDRDYQREIGTRNGKSLVRAIAAQFSWTAFQCLTVGRRPDGVLTVIDGQHSLAAARLLELPKVPCVIFPLEHTKAEAQLFLRINKSRRQISQIDKFRASLAAEDSDAVLVTQLLKKTGWTIAPHTNYTSWKAGDYAAFATLAGLLRQYKQHHVSLALRALREGYDVPVKNIARLLPGIVAAVSTSPKLSAAALSSLLSRKTEARWLALAMTVRSNGGHTHTTALATVIVREAHKVGLIV
jgi:hypothetical protein